MNGNMTVKEFREKMIELIENYDLNDITTFEDCYEAKQTIDDVVGEIIYMIASKFAKFELERAKEKK
jgi:hypothetical protein